MITSETTVLWSTAYLDEAHSFDTAVVIDKGKVIYEGKPHDLASTPQEFILFCKNTDILQTLISIKIITTCIKSNT